MDDLQRKTRPDDLLGNLPLEQQTRILAWLGEASYADVLKRIAAPPPHGLGLTVPYTTLRRFYIKNLPEKLRQTRLSEMLELRAAAELVSVEPAPYEILAKEALQRHVFLQSLCPEAHGDKFRRNLQLLLQWRALDLKEKNFERGLANPASPPQSTPQLPPLQVLAQIQAHLTAPSAPLPPPSAPPQSLSNPEPRPLLPASPPLCPGEALPEPPPPASADTSPPHQLARFSTI